MKNTLQRGSDSDQARKNYFFTYPHMGGYEKFPKP